MNLNQIKKTVVNFLKGIGRDVSEQDVEDFVYADWNNQIEHQEWLKEASDKEIADWVIAGLR